MITPPRELLELRPDGQLAPPADETIIAAARRILEHRVMRQASIASPSDLKDLLILRLGALPYEVFAVLFLDVRHRVIEIREMFRGTLHQTAVYPREVVKEALELNAGAVVVAHCHPSGEPEPSLADKKLTQTLMSALQLIDVRLIDHIVVAGGHAASFAELGLL